MKRRMKYLYGSQGELQWSHLDEIQYRMWFGWKNATVFANWAQFLLKFIVSHPAVTCAIPATSNPAHMLENMGANFGRLPDAALRRRMAQHFDGM